MSRPLRMTPVLIAVLGLLSMGGAFAMDIYLPALPDVGASLNASNALVQVTLSSFLIGAAVGQFFFGPISDRWGRWRPLMVGSVIFLLAGAAGAIVDSITLLIILRFIQGVGSAAGVVIGRAVVADLTTGVQRARLFGILMMLFGIAPVIAPIMGGPITEWGGWRATMWAIAVMAGLMLVGAFFVPESLKREDRRLVRFSTVFSDIGTLAKNRYFLFCVLTLTTGFGVTIAWLTASSFVLQGHFGLTPNQYALVFAANSGGYLVAGLINTVLLRWFSPKIILGWAVALNLVLMVTLFILVITVEPPVLVVMVFVTLSFGAQAPILANTTALAIGAVPANTAGAASAFMGSAQQIVPSAIIPVVGLFGVTPTPMTVAFVVSAILCAVFFVLLWRSPEPDQLQPQPSPDYG